MKLSNKEKQQLAQGFKDYALDIYRKALSECKSYEGDDKLEIDTMLFSYGVDEGICDFFNKRGLYDFKILCCAQLKKGYLCQTPHEIYYHHADFLPYILNVIAVTEFRIKYMEDFISQWIDYKPWYKRIFNSWKK